VSGAPVEVSCHLYHDPSTGRPTRQTPSEQTTTAAPPP
jgi:hypothetical protein